MNRVTFFEFTTPDPAKEIDFFKGVFGWQIEKWGDQEYWLVKTGENEAGIDGAITPPPMPTAPRVYDTISVADIDATIAAATAAGATVVVPKAEVPNTGWLAYLASPTGIMFGVIQQSGSM